MHAKKEKIRRSMLERRAELEPPRVKAASLEIIQWIRGLPQWKNAREVLVYWPVQNEVDVRPLFADLWQGDVRVLLPRCRPGQPGLMDLCHVTCEAELVQGMYAIMEPGPSCLIVDDFRPDVCLVPGVGFDERGYRLGFGGGYYDRMLEKPMMASALKVGICYDFQVRRKVPNDDWDQPMNAICTEKRLFWCHQPS